jgi:hypothetical protein
MRKPAFFLPIKSGLLCVVLASVPGAVLAQGSAGGSIGNDDKQYSGSRGGSFPEPEASHRPAAHRKQEGGGREHFDGRWSFVTTGCPDAGTIGAMIRGGRFTTAISHGTVSPDGAFHATGGGGGVTFTAGGHMASSSGSGTFHRSDGWSAAKL